MLGSVTFQKTCQSLAPSVRAASSSDMSMASRMGISSRTTNGRVTKRVASAIPARQCQSNFNAIFLGVQTLDFWGLLLRQSG